jgi:hypothetical protein
MSIQYINTGTAPNSGNGDVLRTAFNKVNANFKDITTYIVQSSTPPATTGTTVLWYDTVGGRTYTYFDRSWVDISPIFLYPYANTSTAGVVKVDGSTLININNSGTIGVNSSALSISTLNSRGAGSNVTIIATSGTNTATWSFSDSGVIDLTKNGVIRNQVDSKYVNLVASDTVQLQWTTDAGVAESNPNATAERTNWLYVDGEGVIIQNNFNSSTTYTWNFDRLGISTFPGLMVLPVTAAIPTITTPAGTVAVCDGSGWDGGGDGLQHLMIYINGTWTKVV